MNLNDPMPYTIYFENVPTALAYARRVTVSDPIDPNLDIRSFRLGQIVFNNRTISVPANRSYFQTRVNMTDQGSNIVVDVSAGVDLIARRVFWTLTAIDLDTGEPPLSVNQGVLPPDATNQIGQGFVVYTLKPAAGVASGTVISNKATIVFDDNAPIDTRVVLNIVDSLAPTSAVTALPAVTLSPSFNVSWSGIDETNGSGLRDFDIYYSDNGGSLVLWQGGTTNESAQFIGQGGHTYYFYSRARDNAGNVEAAHSTADAFTLVSGNSAPAVPNISDQVVSVNSGLCFTNVITDVDGGSFTTTLLNPPAGATAQIVNGTNLVVCLSPGLNQGGSTNLLQVVVTDDGVPSLSTTQTFIVAIPDYARIDLGSASAAPGQSTCLPITLASSPQFTNIQFRVNVPAGVLGGVSVNPLIAGVCSGGVQSLGSTQLLVTLLACSGQTFVATQQQVAALCFTINTNQPGSIPLNIAQVSGIKANGSAITGVPGQSGLLTVVLPGTPPVIEQITNVVIAPEDFVRFKVFASDADGDLLAYTLEPGAPAKARIVSTNGVFTWKPTRTYASSTNAITVRVTDNSPSTLSTTQTFLVTVLDYLDMAIGSTNVQTGNSVGVPIYLASSEGVSNLTFNLVWPGDRFTNSAITVVAPGISANSLQDQLTNLLIAIQTAPGQVLQGTQQQILQLTFTAVTNQTSAFVPLVFGSANAVKPGNVTYSNYITHPGNVTVIQDKPLLIAATDTNQNRNLTLLGRLGTNYQLQFSTNLLLNSWSPAVNYTQTNGSITIGIDATNATIFYRLFQP